MSHADDAIPVIDTRLEALRYVPPEHLGAVYLACRSRAASFDARRGSFGAWVNGVRRSTVRAEQRKELRWRRRCRLAARPIAAPSGRDLVLERDLVDLVLRRADMLAPARRAFLILAARTSMHRSGHAFNMTMGGAAANLAHIRALLTDPHRLSRYVSNARVGGGSAA